MIPDDFKRAIEHGDALAPLVAQLSARQREREELLVRIAGTEAAGRTVVDRTAVEARVDGVLAVWRSYLEDPVANGRRLLREALVGPLVFTPDGDGYYFKAPTKTGELIAGAIEEVAHKVVSPDGFEPAFWP